ncbi:alpha/beta fold hydrolase [Schumannella luteola]
MLIDVHGAPLEVTLFEPSPGIEHRGDALLVHGFTGSKEDFAPLGPLLAERGYRVATFDNRGQHESSHAADESAYRIPALAADTAALADALGLERPHLLGHSFGGLIAQHAVVDGPARWASLTLLCSGPGANPRRGNYEAIIAELDSKTMAESWVGDRERWAAGEADPDMLKRRWLATDPRSLAVHARELMSAPSLVAGVAATGIPAHVAFGVTDDAWPQELQREMAADLDALLTVIPDAGHCPNTENPALTAELLADFWDSSSPR